MHFVDRELNERLAIFGSGQYKSIIGDDSPPCYSLDELDARMFKTLTRFNVKVDEVTYECALTPSLQKEMYVFLSGAQIRQGLRAAFNRISWHQYFHGVCICIEDPTYKVEKVNNLWGGYFGTAQKFYVNGVQKILQRLQAVYRIPDVNVFLIASSAGGYASLHIAARSEGYKCLVRNPQIFLGERELQGLREKEKLELSAEKYRERLDLADRIVANKTARFYMLFNRSSDWDMGNLTQLLAKFGETDIERNYYRFGNKHILVMDTPIKEPHNNHCTPFSGTVMIRLGILPPDDLEYLLLAFFDANKERYQMMDKATERYHENVKLKSQAKEKEEKRRTIFNETVKDLCTARIDIKNCGHDNSLEITNLDPNSTFVLDEPDWYKNEEGQGTVIQSDNGYLHIRVLCHGTGILKIDFRGITRLDKTGKRLPYWITYTSFRCDGKEIFQNHYDVWHDKPIKCQMKVQNEREVEMEFRWRPCIRCKELCCVEDQ